MSEDATKKTIILHIGRHKTGTTSIQGTFKANIQRLRERGVFYPKSLSGCHSAFLIDAFSHVAERHPVHNKTGRTRAQIQNDTKDRLSKIRGELHHFHGDKVVFSGEDACMSLREPDLRHLKATMQDLCGEDIDFKVLLYTRDPIARAESGTQQLIKANQLTEEDARIFALRGDGKRYRAIYDTYAAVFGDKAIEFRSYEVACSKDLIKDFFSAIDVSPDDLKPLKRPQNERISAEVLRFLSWLYEGPRVSMSPAPQQHRKTRAPLSPEEKQLLFGIKGAWPRFFSYAEQMQIWEEVAEDMRFLQERFGITYEPPQASEDEEEPKLFGPTFMTGLEQAFPHLNAALQNEVKRFLREQGVEPFPLSTVG